MNNSISITEYQIRRPLNADLRLDSLPPELQGVAADLLSTITDAAMRNDPGALAELRSIASKLAQKSTLEDPYQRDRPLVSELAKRAKDSVRDGEAPEMAARILQDGLGLVDPAFGNLDPAAIAPMLRLRSAHELAAMLTVESEAFGETRPDSKAARADAIARVRRLSERAASA